jgi:hypothetical protein
VVTGQTNGTNYSFVVRVCNTDGRCTDSDPENLVPSDSPEIGTLSATAVGRQVRFTWTDVSMNFRGP